MACDTYALRAFTWRRSPVSVGIHESLLTPRRIKMFNPSKGRPAAQWALKFDFASKLNPQMSPPHSHEFGVGYDLMFKDSLGKVQAKIDGLRPDEADFLRFKHNL